MTYQTSARNGLPLSEGGAAPAAVCGAWSLLQPSPGSYPVVDVFHQPESGCLHCIALLLQLPQQVYVRRAGLMQGPSALEAPLLQLHLHGQLTLQQQALGQMPAGRCGLHIPCTGRLLQRAGQVQCCRRVFQLLLIFRHRPVWRPLCAFKHSSHCE